MIEDTFSRGYDDHHFLGDHEVDGKVVVYGSAPPAPPEGGRPIATSPAPAGATGDGAGNMVAYLVPA